MRTACTLSKYHPNMVNIGDIVLFKDLDETELSDLIRSQVYGKFMIVIDVIDSKIKKSIKVCKVMTASGDINWVAQEKIVTVSKLNERI